MQSDFISLPSSVFSYNCRGICQSVHIFLPSLQCDGILALKVTPLNGDLQRDILRGRVSHNDLQHCLLLQSQKTKCHRYEHQKHLSNQQI